MPALESSSERPLPVNPRRLVGLYAAKSSVLCLLVHLRSGSCLKGRRQCVCMHYPSSANRAATVTITARPLLGYKGFVGSTIHALSFVCDCHPTKPFQSRFCAVTPQAHVLSGASGCFRLRCVLATCRSCVRAVNEATGIARHLAGSDPKASSTLRREHNASSCIGSGFNESQQRVAPTQRSSVACLQPLRLAIETRTHWSQQG